MAARVRRHIISSTTQGGNAVKIFAVRGRRGTASGPGASGSLPSSQRSGLPHGYGVVGDALASGSGIADACAAAGQEIARDGGSMQEALEALSTTWRIVRGTDPAHDAVIALLTAWNETTLGYLLQGTCEDPLTGLASLAHLRTRLAELYRNPGTSSYGLVLCTMPGGDDPSDEQGDHFTRAMRQARMGEMARTVFLRNETIARVGFHNVAVLVLRDERLDRRVRVLQTLLDRLETDVAPARVSVEGLPGSESGALHLLDALALG